jgi:hypothetical protein
VLPITPNSESDECAAAPAAAYAVIPSAAVTSTGTDSLELGGLTTALKQELANEQEGVVAAPQEEDEFDALVRSGKQNGAAAAVAIKTEAVAVDYMSVAAEDVLIDGSDFKR